MLGDRPSPRPRWFHDRVFTVREGDRTVTVELGDQGLVRIVPRVFGNDERRYLPYSHIAMVIHRRRRLHADQVAVYLRDSVIEWRVAHEPDRFVERLQDCRRDGTAGG